VEDLLGIYISVVEGCHSPRFINYCSISGNFPIVWTNETGGSGVEMTPECGGVEVGGFAVLPAPRNLEGWSGFKRNDRGAGFQIRGLETTFASRSNGRGPDMESSLKGY